MSFLRDESSSSPPFKLAVLKLLNLREVGLGCVGGAPGRRKGASLVDLDGVDDDVVVVVVVVVEAQRIPEGRVKRHNEIATNEMILVDCALVETIVMEARDFIFVSCIFLFRSLEVLEMVCCFLRSSGLSQSASRDYVDFQVIAWFRAERH